MVTYNNILTQTVNEYNFINKLIDNIDDEAIFASVKNMVQTYGNRVAFNQKQLSKRRYKSPLYFWRNHKLYKSYFDYSTDMVLDLVDKLSDIMEESKQDLDEEIEWVKAERKLDRLRAKHTRVTGFMGFSNNLNN